MRGRSRPGHGVHGFSNMNISHSTGHDLNRKMSIRKRNEFLEGEESDNDTGSGYDSEAVLESRGALTGRASKRRKVGARSDDDLSAGSDVGGDEIAGNTASHSPNVGYKKSDDEPEIDDEDENGATLGTEEHEKTSKTRPKSTAPKTATAAQKAARKSGVVYISRVPPFMKPQTVKHFLAPHAPRGLGRIFLTPEDHASHTRRVKSGGNKKKSFTDGWIEFTSKRDAKIATELLNGNIIGGKKGNFYHDDIWNMKYLKGFKWAHLTEQIANENAERAARMREEVRRTKVENRRFVEDVERGKMLEGMEGKHKARGLDEGDGEGKERRKEFKQRKVQKAEDDGDKKAAEFLQRAGRKIF